MESGGDGYLMVDLLSHDYRSVAPRMAFPLLELVGHLLAASINSPEIVTC